MLLPGERKWVQEEKVTLEDRQLEDDGVMACGPVASGGGRYLLARQDRYSERQTPVAQYQNKGRRGWLLPPAGDTSCLLHSRTML
jgi:hypothetical protein